MSCADVYYGADYDKWRKQRYELSSKFNKDKVILNYLYENNDEKLRPYCEDIISLILKEDGTNAFDYVGMYITFSSIELPILEKKRFVKKLVKLNNDKILKLIYNDGPVTKLYEINNLTDKEFYDFTIHLMDNLIETLEDKIKLREKIKQEQEWEESKNYFYEHW